MSIDDKFLLSGILLPLLETGDVGNCALQKPPLFLASPTSSNARASRCSDSARMTYNNL